LGERRPKIEEPAPFAWVLGADYLPGFHVDHGIGPVADDASFGNIALERLLTPCR
jgi:hypothetical protein